MEDLSCPRMGIHYLKSLLIAILISSCGYKPDFLHINNPAPYKKHKSDPEFASYIHSFETISKKAVTVPVVFSDLDLSVAGVCSVWSDGYKEVTVSRFYWILYSDTLREILLFHELGHCVLGLSHNDAKSFNCPASIMQSYIFTEDEARDCYEKNRFYYLEEISGE